jgi:hypothetical protein
MLTLFNESSSKNDATNTSTESSWHFFSWYEILRSDSDKEYCLEPLKTGDELIPILDTNANVVPEETNPPAIVVCTVMYLATAIWSIRALAKYAKNLSLSTDEEESNQYRLD